MTDPASKKTETLKKDHKRVRDEANEADMTSSPALNDDANTDSDGAGKQDLPKSNRFA